MPFIALPAPYPKGLFSNASITYFHILILPCEPPSFPTFIILFIILSNILVSTPMIIVITAIIINPIINNFKPLLFFCFFISIMLFVRIYKTAIMLIIIPTLLDSKIEIVVDIPIYT